MATVKLGKEIRERILQRARSRFEAKVTAAKDSRPAGDWGEIIYNKFFAQYKDVLDTTPKEFLSYNDEIKVGSVCNVTANLMFRLPDMRPLPHKWQSELGRSYSQMYFELFMHDEWMPLHNEVVAWHDRINKARGQQNEFLANMEKILDAYSTLAPALRAWPPLWDYVPDDIKDRHRAVEVREKKKVEVDVDLAKLTALATANKLGA